MIPQLVSRIVLLVEGDGDQAAVPELVRRVSLRLDLHGMQPTSKPIRCGGLERLQREGELERFVTYGCQRHDGDGALLVLDCDDDCPKEAVSAFALRIAPIAQRFSKKIGIAFLRREFETLFLFCVKRICERYPSCDWDPKSFEVNRELEEIRGAKEALARLMRWGKYKETRDQARFVTALDFDLLAQRSRSYRHLESTLRWLAQPPDGTSWVYPAPRSG